MYQQYWGLHESPFRGGLEPSLFYATANHEEALARLNFLVEERRRLGIVAGPAGVGKSLLLEIFARQIRAAGGEVARTSLTGLDGQEFLWSMAAQWGLNPALSASPFALWRRLADRLIEGRYQQVQMLALLDDAEQARPDVADLVLRLAQLDPHADSRLSIVLATNYSQIDRLPQRLLELAELAVHLEPWTADDTRGYLEFAMEHAGRHLPVYTLDAAERLHALGGGLPLHIKQLADLALMAGAGLGQSQVDADTVEGAFQELGVVVAAPRATSASR
jgi:type II secretory pathway predicted ATPase ExeA